MASKAAKSFNAVAILLMLQSLFLYNPHWSQAVKVQNGLGSIFPPPHLNILLTIYLIFSPAAWAAIKDL